jgi:hypothetical protein
MVIVLGLATLFFCHSLIRLVMLMIKERRKKRQRERGQLSDSDGGGSSDPRDHHRDWYRRHQPEMVGPTTVPFGYDNQGYAQPAQPIPVVLVQDEEAAGIESEATKTQPPAYGVWRGSVVRRETSPKQSIIRQIQTTLGLLTHHLPYF